MKFSNILFVALCCLQQLIFAQDPIYQPEREKTHNLVHTKLNVDFNFAAKTMNGEAWITAKPHFYSSKTITLDAKAMVIHEVKMNQKPLTFSYDDNLKLNIQLPKTFQKDEEFTIYIKYTAQPEKVYQKGSSAITDAKGLYFINPDGLNKTKPKKIGTQGET